MQKNRSKKLENEHLANIQEMRRFYFENRPSCKGYSPCKGYSLCKMVSLGQKLKMRKTCEKPFYKNIRVVLCKKPLEKNTKYSKKWDDFENRPSCKGYSPCKGYSLCKMVSLGQKLKMPKTCEKPFYKKLELFCAKNRSKKHQIFEEMRRFWKSAILQRL